MPDEQQPPGRFVAERVLGAWEGPATPPFLVLIGPAGTGKTTLGRALAALTGRPFVDLDAEGQRYYADVGWSLSQLEERIAAVGRLDAEVEWEPTRAHAVTRAVAEYSGAVLALGAGHTSYTAQEYLDRVIAALKLCPAVVRVLPSPDADASLEVLRRRCLTDKQRSWIIDGHDFLAHWLQDRDLDPVVTHVVYTEGETPAETAARLLDSLAGPG